MNEGTRLIAIRHGDYDLRGNLASSYYERTQQLAKLIQEINPDRLPVFLLCSTAPRALQGGQILCEELAIPVENILFDPDLWDNSSHSPDWSRGLALVKQKLFDDSLTVVISHLAMVPDIVSSVAPSFGLMKKYLRDPAYNSGWLVSQQGIIPFP